MHWKQRTKLKHNKRQRRRERKEVERLYRERILIPVGELFSDLDNKKRVGVDTN